MNLVDNPYSLKSGEAQYASNVDLSQRDVLSKRRGYLPIALPGSISYATQTKSPGTVDGTTSKSGTTPWTNPDFAKTSNDLRAEAVFAGLPAPNPVSSKVLLLSNFGFSLPTGAIPSSILVEVEKSKTPAGGASVIDVVVKLKGVGLLLFSTNKATATDWPGATDAYVAYGSLIGDLWGTNPTRAQINSSEFTVEIQAKGPEGTRARIDHVKVTVQYYIEEVLSVSASDHMRAWYTGANRFLMKSRNGAILALNAAAKTLQELFAGTAGTIWDFEQMEYNSGGFKDSLWAMNGTDAAKKWDGTTFANWAGKPPKGTMLRVWKNRMIVSGVAAFPQRVFFSEIGNPELPEDETNGGYGNNWIDIRTSEDDLDPVTWLEVLDDVLLVFKKQSVNAVFDPTSFSFQRIANVGCEARFQSCVVDSRCYFVNRSGVYSVRVTGDQRYESLNIEPLFKGTGPLGFEAINLNLLSQARMVSTASGRVYLACTMPNQLANRLLLEAYPRLRNVVDKQEARTPWVRHVFGTRCIKSLASYRITDAEVDQLVASITDSTGASPELVTLFFGESDGASPIEFDWHSGFKSLIADEPIERVRRVNLLMKGQLTATLNVDGEDKEPLELETSEGGNEIEVQRYRPEGRGRYHSLKLHGSGPSITQVFKGELVLRGGKEH